MSIETIAMIVGGFTVGLISLGIVLVRMPKKLKADHFAACWKDLQGHCRDKNTWPEAIQEADKLLDKALKKRKFKGKTMGERMVSAQRTFTDNDAAWFAHNIFKKIKADPNFKLREKDVKNALVGFRQALRDLGALPDGSKSRD